MIFTSWCECLGLLQNGFYKEELENPSWKRPLPHILVATLSSFLFGYHIGVVNETLETISLDLGFGGSTMAEGLVVSTCFAGAFVGSVFSGWIADGVGWRRAFQLSALPMIIGASMSYFFEFRVLLMLFNKAALSSCSFPSANVMITLCQVSFQSISSIHIASEKKLAIRMTNTAAATRKNWCKDENDVKLWGEMCILVDVDYCKVLARFALLK